MMVMRMAGMSLEEVVSTSNVTARNERRIEDEGLLCLLTYHEYVLT